MLGRIVKIAIPIIIVAAIAFGIAAFRQALDARVLAAGEFHSVSHKGKGSVRIVEKDDGRRFLQIDEFQTYHRPDLVVLLISANDAFENEAVKAAGKFEVGRLKRDEGSMEYELPIDLEMDRFNAVTVWNNEYEVNYTTAPLTKTKEKGK